MLVVNLTHAAFFLVEKDAVIGAKALVEVRTEVQRHRLQPHLSFNLEKEH